MAFSRRVKNQTWFARLPSGQIEVITGPALEEAFRCGLIDRRTPVCAFGTHVWGTLAEAADLEDGESSSFGSLSPTALDTPLPEPSAIDRASWSRGQDVDARSFRSRTAGAFAALIAMASVAALVGLATRVIPSTHASRGAAAGAETPVSVEAMTVPAPTPAPPPTGIASNSSAPGAARPAAPHLTREQVRRLREKDFIQRMSKPGKHRSHQTTSRTPLDPPSSRSGNKSIPPEANRFDPLNGAL